MLSDVAIEIMQQIASDVNKPRRELFLEAPYLVARKSQHSGTGTWWIRSDTFSDWKYSGPSSLLWMHGKR